MAMSLNSGSTYEELMRIINSESIQDNSMMMNTYELSSARKRYESTEYDTTTSTTSLNNSDQSPSRLKFNNFSTSTPLASILPGTKREPKFNNVSSIHNVSENSTCSTIDFIEAEEKLTELMNLMQNLKAKSTAIFQEIEKIGKTTK